MTNSDSPKMWDHAGHIIRAQVPDAAPRQLPGNAWCYDCQVPIEADWSIDRGLKPLGSTLSFGRL